MADKTIGRDHIIALLVLCVVTAATFAPIVNHHFSGWDDDKFLSAIWKPSLERAYLIVTDFDLNYTKEIYYSPLPFLSLMVDQSLVSSQKSPEAWISKLVNLILHTLNTVLVFLLLHWLGLSRRYALFGALLFGVHPLQVGTVAWIAERKNLLVALFYLASLITYIKYLQVQRPILLFALAGLLIFGLLSKPAAAFIPLALLGYRFLLSRQEDIGSKEILFFVISLGFAFLWGLYVLSTEHTFQWILPPIRYRPLLAAAAIIFYLSKVVLPINLAAIYPKWDIVQNVTWFLAPFFALLAALTILWCFRKQMGNRIVFGVFFFFLNLLPVVGLIPFGYMSHSYVADHFMYLPMVGLSIVIGSLAQRLFQLVGSQSPKRTAILFFVFYSIFAALSLTSIRQTLQWKNSESVWESTLKVNPNAVSALNNYGMLLMNRGELDKALEMFNRAVELAPTLPQVYHNMGSLFHIKGDDDKALQMYAKAREFNPNSVSSYKIPSSIMSKQGNYQGAIELIQRGLELNPRSPVLADHLGILLHEQGKVEEAIKLFDKAIEFSKMYAPAYVHRGVAMFEQGKLTQASNDSRRALSITNLPEAHNLLAVIAASQGRLPIALEHFLNAYELQPNLPGLTDNVANILIDMGKPKVASKFCRDEGKHGRHCSEPTHKRIMSRLKGKSELLTPNKSRAN